MGIREGGRFELRFSAPADVGALVEAAVSEARDALFRAGMPEVTWADALVEVCARSLGTVAVAQPAGLVPGVCASGCRGWLVDRAAAAAGASGGQADLCGDGAAGVAAGRGAGQCGAGVADRAGADPPVGAGPGPGVPFSRLRGAGASGGPSRGPLGRRRPDGPGQPGRRCARSITTRTTAASSRSPVMRTCRRVGVPGPGRVPDRAGPDLRPAPPPGRPAAEPGSTPGRRAGVGGAGVHDRRSRPTARTARTRSTS